MKILICLLTSTLFLLAGKDTPPLKSTIYSTLTVNGFPLGSDSLSFNSSGTLALVEGVIRWSKRKAVPYQELVQGDLVQHQQLPTLLIRNAEIWPAAWLRDMVVDPSPSTHKPIPVRVSLRRGGVVLRQWPAKPGKQVYSLPLAEVWPSARLGDELVVEPVRGSAPHSKSVENHGKRVMKLEKVNRPITAGC